MQGYFNQAKQSKQVTQCSYLVDHDAAFFHSKAEQARHAVTQFPSVFGARLAPLLHKHDQVVEIMADQPRTFVHGHYRPQNILVSLEATPVRICPVDWEVAARGSPLYDFAFLADGFEGAMLDQLGEAYRQEAMQWRVPLPGKDEMLYLVACFGLHRTLTVLGKAVAEQFTESGVAKLLERAEAFNSRLR
jgi:thiamine kinase-like enzyme